MKAARVSSRSREDVFLSEGAPQDAGENAGWSWPARFAFMLAAGALSWIVPLAVVYLVFF